MVRVFAPSLYRTNAAQTPPPTDDAARAMIQALENCNERLKETPYDPELWTERAGYYLALNYPELAAGDAYKAGLLFDRASKPDEKGKDVRNNEDTGAEQRAPSQARLRAYGILGQALYDCHCHLEAAEFWEDVANKVPGPSAQSKAAELRALLKAKEEAAAAAGLGGTPLEQKDRLKDGGVITVNYPWLEEKHLTRTSETIAMVNAELSNMEPQSCYLAPSTISNRPNMLGIFASRDLQAGEYFLLDRTGTGTCSNSTGFICANCYGRVKCPPIQAPCCSHISNDTAHESRDVTKGSYSVYCSTACYDLAMSTYHKATCSKDFTWLTSPAAGLTENASPMRPLLMLRFLATCVQAGPDTHPLSHPLIARLQPLANRDHVDVFTLAESIAAPNRILEALGIDIFANTNYSTAVLHALWTRIANNKCGSPDPQRGFIEQVNAFAPLVNHSCDPNVEYKREDSSTTLKFFTKRDVKRGEEMFVEYLNVAGMPVGMREERLWPWFEGACLCARCVRDRAQLEALRPKEAEKVPWK